MPITIIVLDECGGLSATFVQISKLQKLEGIMHLN